jgi:hypothetical protein
VQTCFLVGNYFSFGIVSYSEKDRIYAWSSILKFLKPKTLYLFFQVQTVPSVVGTYSDTEDLSLVNKFNNRSCSIHTHTSWFMSAFLAMRILQCIEENSKAMACMCDFVKISTVFALILVF